MEQPTQDKLNSLRKFVANNEDLEVLEAKLNEFNPFNVLRVAGVEIRHSNILAWLLDPKENHNLGDVFLKKILAEIIVNNEHLETDINVFDTQEMLYHDVDVKREEDYIDILVLIKGKDTKLAVLIENKVGGGEEEGQLEKYLSVVSSQYGSYEIVPVFLTLMGDEPSEGNKDKYGIISYLHVRKILKFIISVQKENLNPKVVDFLFYYLKILDVLTMEDKNIKNLCKKIYKEHIDALKLIYQYADETEFESAAMEFIDSLDAKVISINGKQAWFLPKSILSKMKKVGVESWHDGVPLAFRFRALEEKLGILIEVGPFKDGALRRKFLKHLQENGFAIREHSFKEGAKYTRFVSAYPKFDDWDDKDSIIQKMEDAFNEIAKQHIETLENACASFDWGDV